MTKSDPFLSGLNAEVDSRKNAAAKLPRGMMLVTPAEVGMHLPVNDPYRARKICHKPTDTAEGHAVWQRQSEATHNRVEEEGGAILVLGMRGLRQGTEDFKKAFAAWKAGTLVLPSLADALGLKSPNNQKDIAPRAEAARRETNEQLEARLKRQAEEKRTGVRLERPTIIGR